MKNLEIDFVSREHESIRVISQTSVEDLNMFSEGSIFLLQDNKRYLLSEYDLHDNMYVSKALLTKALNNELQLHPTIQKDIGYLLNQEWQNKKDPDLFYKKFEGVDYWVGNSYLVWNHDLATWLFNDIHGSIILHITPIYPGNYSDFPISYEQWLADYRPFFTTVVPRESAVFWLKQAEELVDIIEWNSNNWNERKGN